MTKIYIKYIISPHDQINTFSPTAILQTITYSNLQFRKLNTQFLNKNSICTFIKFTRRITITQFVPMNKKKQIQNTNPTLLQEYKNNQEFQAAMQANQRQYQQLQQISIYSNLEKIEKLKTFQKREASLNSDTLYCFYGMFLPRYKKYEDKVFLTLIKILEQDLTTMKGNYSIIFFNSLCQGYDAFMGFKSMLKRFPQKYFQKLSKILIVHPEKSLVPVQWLSFGIVNKLIDKLTIFVKNIDQLSQHQINIEHLLVTLPKQIVDFDNKADSSIKENAVQSQKQSKQQITKKLEEYELSQIGIPVYLRTLISYFQMKPEKLRIEGIFRKNGSIDDINLLSRQMMKKSYDVLFLMEDPHPACALIKGFFNDLKEPIFSYENYQQILSTNIEEYSTLAKPILKNMPILNYKVLLLTLGFLLYRVVSQQKNNKMSIYNICVCFAPCFFKPKQYEKQDIFHTTKFVAFLMKIISRYSKYFSSKNQDGNVYREQAQNCMKQLKKMMPRARKTVTANNLQSKIPDKPNRMNFYTQNQQ